MLISIKVLVVRVHIAVYLDRRLRYIYIGTLHVYISLYYSGFTQLYKCLYMYIYVYRVYTTVQVPIYKYPCLALVVAPERQLMYIIDLDLYMGIIYIYIYRVEPGV